LVENARRKRRLNRGGDVARLPLEEAELLAPEPSEDVLALDEALTEPAATDRAAADLLPYGNEAQAHPSSRLGPLLPAASAVSAKYPPCRLRCAPFGTARAWPVRPAGRTGDHSFPLEALPKPRFCEHPDFGLFSSGFLRFWQSLLARIAQMTLPFWLGV